MNILREAEYTQIQPPIFMKKSIMEQTCQLSDFRERLYKVGSGEEGGEPYYMIANS